jgi:hypothetical protein
MWGLNISGESVKVVGIVSACLSPAEAAVCTAVKPYLLDYWQISDLDIVCTVPSDGDNLVKG